jgi:hypothetical protein
VSVLEDGTATFGEDWRVVGDRRAVAMRKSERPLLTQLVSVDSKGREDLVGVVEMPLQDVEWNDATWTVRKFCCRCFDVLMFVEHALAACAGSSSGGARAGAGHHEAHHHLLRASLCERASLAVFNHAFVRSARSYLRCHVQVREGKLCCCLFFFLC